MKYITEEELAAKLRAEYLKNPPMGLSRRDIELMSDDDILDTDYFMHECEDDDDEVGAEGFYIFQTASSISNARLRAGSFL